MMVNSENDMDAKLTTKNNIKIETYIFDDSENESKGCCENINLWQLIPALFAYLISFSFGIMMGWSSPIYPELLLDGADIQINMDETALIAGFLMIGNMFGVLPAHFMSIHTKWGMITGLVLMPIGWFIMWQGSNIFAILASRFLIGFGHGLGSFHGKQYIKQMAEPPLSDNLTKCSAIYAGFGILLGYAYGGYVNFRTYSVISFFVTAVICVVCVFLPQSPLELVKLNKTAQAKVLLEYLKPELDPDAEIVKLKSNIQNEITDYAYDIVKCKRTRYKFIILMILVFFQQFTGLPSTIVFCMVILNKFALPNAEILAIIYIIVYIVMLIIGNFCIYKYNFKYMLILSSIFTSVFSITNTLVIYFEIHIKWMYLPYFLLICFNISHSIGLSTLPFLLTPKLFPKSPFIAHIQTIFFSIWVIVVTKLFQLLISYQELYTPFLFFGAAGVVATLFIMIFVPSDLKT